MWKLANRPGRFICVERPLIRYRIHDGATTKAALKTTDAGQTRQPCMENLAEAGGKSADAFLPARHIRLMRNNLEYNYGKDGI